MSTTKFESRTARERAETFTTPKVDYPIYDADHHYYEPPEAFLRHLDKKYHEKFQYVTLPNGRTKLAIDNVISNYIPNPTFNVVAGPGTHEDYYRGNNPDNKTMRQMAGEPHKSIPAFHNGEAHLKVMDDLGVHAAIVFPTLASVIEVRLGHQLELTQALFHSLNQWVADEYGFGNGRQYAVGAINLGDAKWALSELEFLLSAGCKQILIRPAPIQTATGTRPWGDPEFDPFWDLCAKEKVLVNHHTSDSGYNRLTREWEGSTAHEWTPFQRASFVDMMDNMGRAANDAISAMVCGGVFDRHPGLRLLITESGAAWIRPMIERFERVYHKLPWEFGRNPVDVVRENIYFMPFYEDSVTQLMEVLPVDNICMGSDWPHPEGLARPMDFFADIKDLSPGDQKKVMSSNLKRLLDGDY